jgi:hypothetical protein
VLGSLTGGADCFLEWRRGVAGKAPGDGGLRPSTNASICYELEPTEGIRGCAREREERKDWREEMGASHRVKIDDKR